MSRKFVSERELSFVSTINKELIQSVVGQLINYYAISVEHTQVHRLYHEAIRKTWFPPVKVNALVKYDNSNTISNALTQDSKYELEVYFHTDELIDRNVVPREGDFVEFGQIFFEITSVTQPQFVFGLVSEKIMTKCVCVPSREGQFQVGNVSSEDVDHSHQINKPIGEEK